MNRYKKYLLLLLFFVILGIFFLNRLSVLRQNDAHNKSEASGQKTLDPPALAETGGHASSSGTSPSWNLLLVNNAHPLPEDLSSEIIPLKDGQAVDSRIYPELQAMLDAARADGLSPLICSSYRTPEKQTALYKKETNSWISRGYSPEEAKKEAAVWVAPPGTSEHQLGLAVDIVSSSYQVLDKTQESTPEQKWLMAHCAEYGFILRYPTEKSDITGIGYEPWHYRYVGKAAAKEIMDRGICLEEYLGSNGE